jgi:hypothetical protein
MKMLFGLVSSFALVILLSAPPAAASAAGSIGARKGVDQAGRS